MYLSEVVGQTDQFGNSMHSFDGLVGTGLQKASNKLASKLVTN